MSKFLLDYPSFVPRPNEPIISEFNRLAVHNQWQKGADEWKKNRRLYIGAAVREEFALAFGVDQDSLEGWKKICVAVGVISAAEVDSLKSVSDCEKKLEGTFVNLVDLTDSLRRGDEVMSRQGVHKSRKALSSYIQATSKYFSLQEAKKLPFLARFLIKVG
ncbi:hypothetical protein BDV98DRAFT_537039 [Pterulicium gracile]|uniref:Uncharacterized protein n=1 Tax=Pterulicium gracile TaxID=1884261 RepID=A0A5C3Q4J1_9AGAR|nr:hypothetical protein BDV98DRAFT_537039 [Pterula gracilis]